VRRCRLAGQPPREATRFGLAVAGLASGFISSVATIATLGGHAARAPALMRPAVAGAVLSNVATVLQMLAALWLGWALA